MAAGMDRRFRNRLLGGLVALAVVVAGGTSGYWLIGGGRWHWFDCLYMTVITITTVGYTENLEGIEHVPEARAFTIALLVFGTGVLVYFASTLTGLVVEGELRRALAATRLRKRIKKMKDHTVVCGAGATGRIIVEELLKTDTPVIAIDLREDELRELAEKHPGKPFAYLVGDATDDDVTARANLGAARGLVAAMPVDKDNLYLVFAAHQIYPDLRIVSRCTDQANLDKLRRAGATGVVSPNFIGGMRLASELVRPQVVRFLDDMLRDQRAAYRIEEVTVADGSRLAGHTLREADVRGRFGMSVIAVRPEGGDAWVYNPEPDTPLGAGMVLVVCGSAEQVGRLRGAADGPA
jgi:voltage-gated potassium channel